MKNAVSWGVFIFVLRRLQVVVQYIYYLNAKNEGSKIAILILI